MDELGFLHVDLGEYDVLDQLELLPDLVAEYRDHESRKRLAHVDPDLLAEGKHH